MGIFSRIFGSKSALADDVKQAALAGDTATLKALALKYGPDVIRLGNNPEELTALHLAAASGSAATVEFLLGDSIGADAKAARINNFTPLHSAAMEGHATICDILLTSGADINIQTDPQKYAPLHSAAYAGHLEVIRLLVNRGADLTLKNYRGEHPVDTARRAGQDEAVRILQEGGA